MSNGKDRIDVISGFIVFVFVIMIYLLRKIRQIGQIRQGVDPLTKKGKVFIRYSFAWFVSIFIISALLDFWLTSSNVINRGTVIFVMTLIVNMPGTLILSYMGAKDLKSCGIDDRIAEGIKITLFGIFWFCFWIILSTAFTDSNFITTKDASLAFLIIAIPGAIINIIIGRWLTKIDVKKELEDLSNAQKIFNKEKTDLESQWTFLRIEKDYINTQKEELQKQKEDFWYQQKESRKQQKELQELRDDNTNKIKEMECQQKEITKARDELEDTWKELEDTVKKNPFKLFISEKLSKDIFIKEIKELKKAKPGDVSSIKTGADQIISDIKQELQREITNIEDERYHEAFSEYFKSINGDKTEHDRIRIKYNPTIHVQVDRRNKEWAERRRFDLSKIEKLMKEEKLTKR